MAEHPLDHELKDLCARYETARELGMSPTDATREMIRDGHLPIPVILVLMEVWGMNLGKAKVFATQVCIAMKAENSGA